MSRCPRCDSSNLSMVSAGLDWLITCNTCGRFERLSDEELMAS